MMPSLESILNELDGDSDVISDVSVRITPTPSIDERPKTGTMLRHVLLQGVTSQIASASVSVKRNQMNKLQTTPKYGTFNIPFCRRESIRDWPHRLQSPI